MLWVRLLRLLWMSGVKEWIIQIRRIGRLVSERIECATHVVRPREVRKLVTQRRVRHVTELAVWHASARIGVDVVAWSGDRS